MISQNKYVMNRKMIWAMAAAGLVASLCYLIGRRTVREPEKPAKVKKQKKSKLGKARKAQSLANGAIH
jgi:hypothetical protein